MELFKKQTHFDFLGKRNLAFAISGILLLISIVSLSTRGLNFGLDFTGGTLIELGYPQAVELIKVRNTLEDAGYKDAVVQHFGTAQDVLVRLAPKEEVSSADLSNEVIKVLKNDGAEDIDIRRVEFVGPQVGDELT